MNVFLDYCSTTQLCQSAKSAILNNLDNFANPSNIYEIGAKAKYQIEKARDNIAKLINAESDEIFFTSGAAEANSWAIDKIYAANKISCLFLTSLKSFVFTYLPVSLVISSPLNKYEFEPVINIEKFPSSLYAFIIGS